MDEKSVLIIILQLSKSVFLDVLEEKSSEEIEKIENLWKGCNNFDKINKFENLFSSEFDGNPEQENVFVTLGMFCVFIFHQKLNP